MKKFSQIEESVWTDIHRRSTGETVRKEDDVNLLDMEDFIKYIEKTYELSKDIDVYYSPYTMCFIPICGCSSGFSYIAFDKFYEDKPFTITIDVRSLNRLPEGCETKLNEKYKIQYKKETPRKQAHIVISPKDGSPVTNSFFIEVIDFLVDNINDQDGYIRLIKKK